MEFDLVFAGGGAKGVAHAGALRELERQGHSFRRVAGTSAGAMTAMFLTAGYDAEGIASIYAAKLPDGSPRLSALKDIPESFDTEVVEKSVPYSALQEAKIPIVPGYAAEQLKDTVMRGMLHSSAFRAFFSFGELGGIYAGTAIVDWLEESLDAGGRGMGQATLGEFFEETGVHFTAVATDLSTSFRLALNYHTAPNVPVKWAVRMSANVPIVWQDVIWQKEWGLYQGQNISGNPIVDGGLVSNFALDLMLSSEADIVAEMGRQLEDRRAIGLLIDQNLPVPGAPAATVAKSTVPRRIRLGGRLSQVEERMDNIISTWTRAHDRIVTQRYPGHVCRLPARGYDTMEFDISAGRRRALIDAGADAMRQYLGQLEV